MLIYSFTNHKNATVTLYDLHKRLLPKLLFGLTLGRSLVFYIAEGLTN